MNQYSNSYIQQLTQIYDDLDATARHSIKELNAEKKKKGKKPGRRMVVKRGFLAEKIRLPVPHNNPMRTHRWAVDVDWLETHYRDDGDQDIIDSDNEIAAPTWILSNANGKQRAKEVYRPKPNGLTNGVPDVRADTESSDSSETDSP